MKIRTICGALLFAAVGLTACSNHNESTINTGPDRSSLRGTPDNGNASTMNANGTNALNADRVTSDSNSNSTGTDSSFWMEAASGGMAEVELGRLAQTKAQNAEVKRFAQMMVADHTKSNDELKALAAKKNVALPPAPNQRHQGMMEQLQNLSGAEFDRAYVDAMVRDHEATVQLFESQTQGAGDAEIKAFAEKTLPTLRQHLEMIRGIREKMK